MKKLNSWLFMTLLVGSLALGITASAQDSDDRDVRVATTASVDAEARVNFEGSNLFPPLPDVSKFLSKPASSSSVSSSMQKIVEADIKLVDARLSALASLKVEIDRSAYLTASQKTSLKAMVDSNISGLTTLLAKIKADTDLAVLKADSEKIYTDFRIFSVFTPKIKALIAFYSQANYSGKANEVLVVVQNKLNDFKDAGVNVVANQAALDAAKASLVQANAKIGTMTTKASDLKPSDFPTISATVISDLKVGVRQVRDFFVQVSNSLRAAIRL